MHTPSVSLRQIQKIKLYSQNMLGSKLSQSRKGTQSDSNTCSAMRHTLQNDTFATRLSVVIILTSNNIHAYAIWVIYF